MNNDNVIDMHGNHAAPPFPALMTVDEVAKQLRVGRNSAYMLVKTGQLRCIKIGRTIRVPRAAVIEFIGEPQVG